MTPKKSQPRASTRPSEASQSGPGSPATPEPELQVEELEERIAPRLASNHNETLLVE
jgi:hypothetical protein